MTKAEKELKEIKTLVREFLEATAHVPFRAVDCNQDVVHNLWHKLTKVAGLFDDRQ